MRAWFPSITKSYSDLSKKKWRAAKHGEYSGTFWSWEKRAFRSKLVWAKHAHVARQLPRQLILLDATSTALRYILQGHFGDIEPPIEMSHYSCWAGLHSKLHPPFALLASKLHQKRAHQINHLPPHSTAVYLHLLGALDFDPCYCYHSNHCSIAKCRLVWIPVISAILFRQDI